MFKRMGLLLVAVFLLTGQALATGTAVVVSADSTVPGPQLRLGDLAVISGDDADKVKALRELKLGNAPSPGNRLLLTADMLAARLTGAGADFSEVSWQIPPLVAITTAGQAVSGEKLQTIAADAIRARLATGGDAADVAVNAAYGTARDVFVPLGRTAFTVDLPHGIRLSGPTTANVIITVDGRLYTTVGLKFAVKVYRKVLVATRNIAPFESITPDSVRPERRDISRLSGYVTDACKVDGLRTRRSIAAGEPLNEAALEKLPIVKQGGAVTILARIGDITVSAGGRALQAGSRGAVIRVQNLNSNKVISARIVDETTVQVIIYSGR